MDDMLESLKKIVKLYPIFDLIRGELYYNGTTGLKQTHPIRHLILNGFDNIMLTDIYNGCNYTLNLNTRKGTLTSNSRTLSTEFYNIIFKLNLDVVNEEIDVLVLYRQYTLNNIIS